MTKNECNFPLKLKITNGNSISSVNLTFKARLNGKNESVLHFVLKLNKLKPMTLAVHCVCMTSEIRFQKLSHRKCSLALYDSIHAEN